MGLISFIKDVGSKVFGSNAKAEDLKKDLDKMDLKADGLKVEVKDDKVVLSGKAPDQATLEKVALELGNRKGIAAVQTDDVEVEKPEEESRYYEVVKGDTLSGISKKMYGNASKYNVIFEANRPMLKDPNLIYPGQKLRIPPLPEQKK